MSFWFVSASTKTSQKKFAEDCWIGAGAHYHDRLKPIDLHEFDSMLVTGPSYMVASRQDTVRLEGIHS